MLDFTILNDIRQQNPVVVTFANFVTPQIVANAINVIGGSPIMTLELAEADDLISLATALTLNLGTSQGAESDFIELKALGTAAHKYKIPVILDPVAVNVPFRSQYVKKLLTNIEIDIIRGNASEIAFFAEINAKSRGIDAVEELDSVSVAIQAAKKTGKIIALTGKIDVITDGRTTYVIHNNTQLLATNVGSGDMLSSLIGTFLLPGVPRLQAVATAVLAMGVAGELAAQKTPNQPGSFSNVLLDELYQLTPTKLTEYGKWDLVND